MYLIGKSIYREKVKDLKLISIIFVSASKSNLFLSKNSCLVIAWSCETDSSLGAFPLRLKAL